uniref:fructose-bisphosphatase n=1 Tax=Lygus hesperus TaxID=30085 RepID=A0A0A9X988_LYGHE
MASEDFCNTEEGAQDNDCACNVPQKENCTCESAKVKELYEAFYGEYEDHAGGAKNVGQWGKLPSFKGPRIWVPPWLDFKTKIEPVKRKEEKKKESKVVSPPKEPIEDTASESLDEITELCKCGEPCYSTSMKLRPEEDPESMDDILLGSDTDTLHKGEGRKSKKKESIFVRDIAHNTILTPTVVLARLERSKTDITPSFISLISFIQVAIKGIRVKILRYKHRTKLAAINFSGSKKHIISNLNDVMISVLTYSGCCYQIYAKGEEDVRLVPPDIQGPYIVCCTGLSGGIDNLECGLDVGTIFSIYKRDPKLSPFAPRTANMSYKYLVSSGYALFTSSTKLVMSIGKKLCSFILDPVVEEFVLNDDNIKIPDKGQQISVDEGHSGLWEPQILEYMKRKKDPKLGRPLKTRCVGSLVADFHRTMYSGGIYLYPANRKNPQGKTTLLCECIPLAHIVDLAGGAASTGKGDVLKTEADQLGQYIPFFIGSKHEVQELLLITSSPARG